MASLNMAMLARHQHRKTIANKPRPYTVSVAISASMIAQLEKPELRTFLAGQIARTLTVMQVDEVVVYEDALIPASGSTTAAAKSTEGAFESASKKNFDATVFLARILQFCEWTLQFAGMINLESPHHTRIDDPIAFREGVTLEATRKDGTLVDCGLRNSIPAFIKDKAIQARCPRHNQALQPEPKTIPSTRIYRAYPATVVSPNHPRETTGVYWGYNVRLAGSIGKVLSESAYEGGYDVTIGVSELAKHCVSEAVTKSSLASIVKSSDGADEADGEAGEAGEAGTPKPFKHMMVVFGGAKGIEYSVGADEDVRAGEDECEQLFSYFVRPLASQGSRRLRTEEAVLITMTSIRNALD
ncbi:putative RNA methyltransferase [Chytriomyces cf. hyalinus JEL632]|nr:putative RNA methyltransferase [Chytriomyces cf. hyalinus JEL632]